VENNEREKQKKRIELRECEIETREGGKARDIILMLKQNNKKGECVYVSAWFPLDT